MTAGASDRADRLQQALRGDPSYQVRLQAAAVLGKLGDRDAVPVLIQAMMEDKHELVRATCADALGQLGDAHARPALKAARSDPSPAVQKRAEAALIRLSEEHRPAEPSQLYAAARRIPVTLGRMGSKARGAITDLPRHLREAIARQLRDTPDVQVIDERQGGKAAGFSVESSVTELSRRTTQSGEMEITCEVSMVIAALPSHAIVGITSGGATIQAPLRRSYKDKAAAQALEADALDHAVRGAHENLVAFLRNQK